MSASDRLGRLLFIVPYVVHRDGVPVAELAQTLGVTAQQIESDINLLSMVGQPPLTPDHLIDLYIEDDVVYVQLDQSLSRPLRLTHEEARALVLGAKLVGGLGGLGAKLAAVLERIVEHLNPVDRAAVLALSARVAVQGDADPYAHAAVLRAAVEARRVIEVSYYSASSDRQKRYSLKPLALLAHGGGDYLVALDRDADDHEKLFRLDRMRAVTPTDAHFSPGRALDLQKFRAQRLYFGAGPLQARVRLDAQLAPQIRDRFAAGEIAQHRDGSLEVVMPTSSAAWLARWVLGFGGQAEVVGPAPCRDAMRHLCQRAAAAYARPTASTAGPAKVDGPRTAGPAARKPRAVPASS